MLPVVNPIGKSVRFNLFNISRSHRSLTADAAKTLIQAYVIHKIDYCNHLLCGIPGRLIQWIPNYAARVLLGLHKFSHITPALATLHWLPDNHRMDSKKALLVYKALNSQAAVYITDLLRSPIAALRSTLEAVIGWQAALLTTALSFKNMWWPRILLCSLALVVWQCKDFQNSWYF